MVSLGRKKANNNNSKQELLRKTVSVRIKIIINILKVNEVGYPITYLQMV